MKLNRREFGKSVAIVGVSALLPSISMAQVRPTTEIEILFDRLGVAFLDNAKAGYKLAISLEEATIASNTLTNQLLEPRFGEFLKELSVPTDKAKSQLLEMGIENNEPA